MSRFRPTTPWVALAWIGILALPVGAQSNYTAQVEFQFRIVRTFAESVGFDQVHKPVFSSLRDDQEKTTPLALRAGHECRIMALCDADCSDLDIVVTDPSGTEVGSDTGLNDAPIVGFRVEEDGEYTVRVRMAACHTEPCYYGIAAFGMWAGR